MAGPNQDKFEVSKNDCDSIKYSNKLLIFECNSDLKRFQFLKRFLIIQRVNLSVLPRLQPISTDTQQRSSTDTQNSIIQFENNCATANLHAVEKARQIV